MNLFNRISKEEKSLLICGPFIGEFFYDVLFFNTGIRYKVESFLDSIDNSQKIIPWYLGMENRFFLYRDFIEEPHKTFIPDKFSKSINQFKTRNRFLKRIGYSKFVKNNEERIIEQAQKILDAKVKILFTLEQTQFFDSNDRPLLDNFKRKFNVPRIANKLLRDQKDFTLDLLFFIPEEPTIFSSLLDPNIWKKWFYRFIKDYPNLRVGFYNSESAFFLSTKKVNVEFYQEFEQIHKIDQRDLTLFLLANSKCIMLPTTEWNVILNQQKIPYISLGNSKFFSQYHFGNINSQNLVISDTLKPDKMYDVYIKPFFQLLWKEINK